MNLVTPLQPKKPESGLRIIIPARISTAGQDLISNLSQHEDVERFLDRVYADRTEIRRLSTRGSGWDPTLETIIQAGELIATGDWDLVIVGELREACRNPKLLWQLVQDCLDSDTRFISIADVIDTADDNWEMMMHAACFRHGMAVPETRRRVKRVATTSFALGGMVLKIKFGYRKLTREEADSGQFGPKGLRIMKLSEWTHALHQMRKMVLKRLSYEQVCDWLEDEGVPPGPYVTSGKWSGYLVKNLLKDRILSGRRQFRKEVSKFIYGTGAHEARANPKPELQEWPELAHFTVEEHDELLKVMDEIAKGARDRQKVGRESTLYKVPRARSLSPGQMVRCGICGGLMYRYGENLKCQNALGRGPAECWNHVLVSISELHTKVLPLVLGYLDTVPEARAIVVSSAWSECQRVRGRQNRTTATISDQIGILEKEARNLAKAVRLGDNLDSLVRELKETEIQLSELRSERDRLKDEGKSAGGYDSEAELLADLPRVLDWLANTSREFAEILRRMIPSFVVFPVQALDCGLVRPRARITISAAAWAAEGAEVPALTETLDLFDPPDPIKYVKVCAEARVANPTLTLRQLGNLINVNYMTVKRSLDYGRRMQHEGLTDPYRELTERPAHASRWKKRIRGTKGTRD